MNPQVHFPPFTKPEAAYDSARLYRETSEIAAAQDVKLDGRLADPVHEPAHYKRGAIECIDYIRESLGPDGFEAYCIGNVIKYVSRYRDKGGVQDLDKAKVYLGWAIETIHRGPSAVVRDTLPPNLAAACRHPMAAEADRIAAQADGYRGFTEDAVGYFHFKPNAALALDVDATVNRFLSWRLPDDFAPDAGISFTPCTSPNPWLGWPIGTNLFTAAQARAMFEHALVFTTSPEDRL